MITSLDAASQRFLLDIERISKKGEKAQNQLSSGLRLANVSDDPDQISALLEARASRERAISTQHTLSRVKTEIDIAEQSLQNSITAVERARVLGAQAATFTQTEGNRKNFADEVTSLMQSLVGLASTSVDGRYVFSGDLDQVPAYQLDLTQPNGVTTYAGSEATREVADASGHTFPLARTAFQIFEGEEDSDNVFKALNTLRLAMEANDSDAINNALTGVRTAADHLNRQLAFYGTVQNTVNDSISSAVMRETQMRAEIAQIEEVDLTRAIIELQQAELQQGAALAARSKLPQQSLFDYLG